MENKKPHQPPEVLYQYRPPAVWAIANLSRRVMYFTPPEKFNDPYDCGLFPKLGYVTGAKYAAFRRALPNLFSGEELSSFDGLSKTEAVDKFNGIIAEKWGIIRERQGVACFSKRNDNLPMWSHYAGRGEGFCLAFDMMEINGELFFEYDEVVPVEYVDKIPAAESMKMWKTDDTALWKLSCYKSKEWEYEREWRIVNLAHGESQYGEELLKAVYFGTRATAGTKELIRAIVEETYPNAELWQGQLSKTEYKVEFDRIR